MHLRGILYTSLVVLGVLVVDKKLGISSMIAGLLPGANKA